MASTCVSNPRRMGLELPRLFPGRLADRQRLPDWAQLVNLEATTASLGHSSEDVFSLARNGSGDPSPTSFGRIQKRLYRALISPFPLTGG